MSNEIQQWQAAYLGQVIRIWIERAQTITFPWEMLCWRLIQTEKMFKNPKL